MEVWRLIEWILKGFQGHKRLLVQTGDEFPKHLDFWNWEWLAAAGKGERCGREKLQMVLFEYLSKDGAPRIFIFQQKSSKKPQPQSQPKAFKTIQLLSSQNLAQLAREIIWKEGKSKPVSPNRLF